MRWAEQREYLVKGLRGYAETGLRYSYFVTGAMVVLGVIVNLFMPHGWVIWPAVLAVGIMTMIHEAAERNNEGVPPFQAYAWFAGALSVWMCFALFLSATGKYLFIVGLPVLVVYCTRTFRTHRKRARLIADRRKQGLCIFCGEKLEPDSTYCLSCGESDIEGDLRRRMQEAITNRSAEDVARTRATLKPESPAAAAKRKEQELLARRQRRSAQRRQPSEQRTKLEGTGDSKP